MLLELKPGCLEFPTHQGQEVTTANHAVATTQIHILYWDVQQLQIRKNNVLTLHPLCRVWFSQLNTNSPNMLFSTYIGGLHVHLLHRKVYYHHLYIPVAKLNYATDITVQES